MQAPQQLSNTDNERILRFCLQINELSEEGRVDANTIIFNEESNIYLNVIPTSAVSFL